MYVPDANIPSVQRHRQGASQAHADTHSNMQALYRAVGMCTQVREQIKQESLRLSVTERKIGLVEGAVQRFQEQSPHPLYCYHGHDVHRRPLASVDIDAYAVYIRIYA